MENISFDRDVACAREDQASFPNIEFDAPTENNIQAHKNPIKEKIKERIQSLEDLLDISISSQITRPPENEEIYSMAVYRLRGVVCILNIKDFEGNDERKGSEMDVKNVINLFEKLGYKIIEIKEVKKEDIVKKIDKIKNYEDLKEASNFIMFLMSHGIEGFLLDAENTEMPIKKTFLEPFSTCEPLFNKPKLFFIQACRGNEKSVALDGPCEKVKTNHIFFDGKSKEKKNFADFFIFNSTYVDHASIRLKKNGIGSVFIRCLVLTISYLCHQHPLNTIMNYVKDIMKSCRISYGDEFLNQIASSDNNSLTKDVYFLPAADNHPSYADILELKRPEYSAEKLQQGEQITGQLNSSFEQLCCNLYLIKKLQVGYDRGRLLEINFEQINDLNKKLQDFQKDFEKVSYFQKYSKELTIIKTHLENVFNIQKDYETYEEDRELSVYLGLKKKKEDLEQVFEDLESDLKLSSQRENIEESAFYNTESGLFVQQHTRHIQLESKILNLKSFLESFQDGFIYLTSFYIEIDKCLNSDHELLKFWKKLDTDLKNDDPKKALIELRWEITRIQESKRLEELRTSKEQDPAYHLKQNGASEQIELHSKSFEEKSKKLHDSLKNLHYMGYFIEQILKGVRKRKNNKIIFEFYDKCLELKNKSKDFQKYFDNFSNFNEFLKNLSDFIDEIEKYKNSPKNEKNNNEHESYYWKFKKKKKQLENVLKDLHKNLFSKLSKSPETNIANVASFCDGEPAESAFQSQTDNQTPQHVEDLFQSLSNVLEGPTKLEIVLDKCLQLDDELLRYWNDLKHTSFVTCKSLFQLYSETKKKKRLLKRDKDKQTIEILHSSPPTLSYNLYLIKKLQTGYDGDLLFEIQFSQIEDLKRELSKFQSDLKTVPAFPKYSKELSNLKIHVEIFGNLHEEYATYDIQRRFRTYKDLKKKKEALEKVFEDLEKDIKLKLSEMGERNPENSKESTFFKNTEIQFSHLQTINNLRGLLLKLSDLKIFLHSFQNGFIDLTSIYIDIDKCLESNNELLNFWQKLDKDFKTFNLGKAPLNLRSEIKKMKKGVLRDLKKQDETHQLEHGESIQNELYSKSLEEKRKKFHDLLNNLSYMEYFIEQILLGIRTNEYTFVDHENILDYYEKFSTFRNKLGDFQKYLDDPTSFNKFFEKLSDLIKELSEYKNSLKKEKKNIGYRKFDSKLRIKKTQLEKVLKDLLENIRKKLPEKNPSNVASLRNNKTINPLNDLIRNLSSFGNDLKAFQSVIEGPIRLCIDLDQCLQLDDELTHYWNDIKHDSPMNQQTLLDLCSKIEKKLKKMYV